MYKLFPKQLAQEAIMDAYIAANPDLPESTRRYAEGLARGEGM